MQQTSSDRAFSLTHRTSITPRQRGFSESAYPHPGEIPYGHQAHLAHGSTPARYNMPYEQPPVNRYPRHDVGAGDRHDAPRQLPESRYRPAHSRTNSNAFHGNSVVANTRDSASMDWGTSSVQDNGIRDATSRRPTRTSVSDRGDATASSRTDASSPRSIREGLQGLALGDHPSSQLIPPHGASSRSQRWDPILGDVQRNHDTSVVSNLFWSMTRPLADTFSDCHLNPRM